MHCDSIQFAVCRNESAWCRFQANAEVNLMLGGNPEVKLMGWLGEKVCEARREQKIQEYLGASRGGDK